MWFTELNANRIGRLDPSKAKSLTSEGITEFELPQPNSKPHFLTIAKNGWIWFTEGANRIGRLDPADGTFKEYDIPSPHSEPHQIIEGPDGSIWFLEFQTNKVGAPGPKDRQDYGIPHWTRQPARSGPGKKTKYGTRRGACSGSIRFFNKLGSLDPATGEVEEMTIPPEKISPTWSDSYPGWQLCG